MTSATEAGDRLLRAVRELIPPLTPRLHKGSCGRVLVVGGSEEYTGAPYLAACAALRTGTDLAHVLCTRSAAVPIKSYSCELIVHPMLDGEYGPLLEQLAPRISAAVIGPGLSRNEELQEAAARVVQLLSQHEIPLVIDADGHQLLVNQQLQLSGWWKPQLVTVTPNTAEFKRLCRVLNVDASGDGDYRAGGDVSRRLGGVLVVQKGECDLLTLAERRVVCDVVGSQRRCGGQGDVLAGVMAAILGWGRSRALEEPGLRLCAAYAACVLTRRASHRAFERYGRGMLASHLLDQINPAFQQVFDMQ